MSALIRMLIASVQRTKTTVCIGIESSRLISVEVCEQETES